MGDMDNDGGAEIVINKMNDTPILLKNLGDRRTGFKSEPLEPGPIAMGLVLVPRSLTVTHRQMDEVHSGESYLTQNDFRLHFGIGKAAKVDRLERDGPAAGRSILQN